MTNEELEARLALMGFRGNFSVYRIWRYTSTRARPIAAFWKEGPMTDRDAGRWYVSTSYVDRWVAHSSADSVWETITQTLEEAR